jgi:hypothetical protein
MTDIEGNVAYFERLVKHNKYLGFLARDKGTDLGLTFLEDDVHFVYTGDVMDNPGQGAIYGDLTVMKALLDLKKRFPTRVSLVLGNRDMNLLRFREELERPGDTAHSIEMNELMDFAGTPSVPLEKALADAWWIAGDVKKEYSELARGRELLTPVEHLRGMLQFTMGRKNTFANARQRIAKHFADSAGPSEEELDALAYFSLWAEVQTTPHTVVVRDTRLRMKNTFHEYLTKAVVAEIVDESMFVHGAVTQWNTSESALGEWATSKDQGTLRGHVENLNFRFQQYLLHGKDHVRFVAMALSASRDTLPANYTSVVTSALDDVGDLVPDELARKLEDSGIHLVISGHRPFANVPHVIRSSGTYNVTMASLDTSYSNIEEGKSGLYSGRSRDPLEWTFVSIDGSHLHIQGQNGMFGMYQACSCAAVPIGTRNAEGMTKSGTQQKDGKCIYASSNGRQTRIALVDACARPALQRGFASRDLTPLPLEP